MDAANAEKMRNMQEKRNCLFPNIMTEISEDEKGKEEKRNFYRVGRMATLFELVDAGKLSFEQVGDFLDWQMEEVLDMYQGYQEAQKL